MLKYRGGGVVKNIWPWPLLAMILTLTVLSAYFVRDLTTRLDALGAENKRLVDHHKVHDKMFEIILANLYPDYGERLNPPDPDTMPAIDSGDSITPIYRYPFNVIPLLQLPNHGPYVGCSKIAKHAISQKEIVDADSTKEQDK